MDSYPTPTRTDSRSRFGIQWFATEQEAARAADYWADAWRARLAAGHVTGYAVAGRDRAYDGPDGYAVIVP